MNNKLTAEKIATRFSKAAEHYDRLASLQREVGNRLFQRLELIRINPQVILDLGSGTGHFTRRLAKRYKKAQVIAVDIAQGMLQQVRKKGWPWARPVAVQAHMAQLPLPSHSVDLIFSNFSIHWHDDYAQLFQELHRVLKPEGLLMFTTVGPDTLKELRQAWQTVDDYTHVNQFTDMHDIGDALLHTHFSDPVMEMEYFCLTYKNAVDLMRELKALGASHIHAARNPHLMGKNRLQQCVSAYEPFRNAQGKLPATYEIVYGHAFVPAVSNRAHANAQGEVSIPLSAIKKHHG